MENRSEKTTISMISVILLIFSFGIGGSFGLISLFIEGDEEDSIIRPNVNIDDLPVDQDYWDRGHTVEEGYVQYIGDNIPDELPICLSPSTASDWWVAFEVRGGYWPCDDQWLWVYQYGSLVTNPCNGMMVGWKLELMDEYWLDKCWCCTKVYNFSIDTSCNNWVCLDSTSVPDGCTNVQENKLVDILFDTHWCGCDFDYILAN